MSIKLTIILNHTFNIINGEWNLEVSNDLAQPSSVWPDYIIGSVWPSPLIIGSHILESSLIHVGHGTIQPSPFIFLF